ncbi:carbohydrate esterase family 3 protein [Biscogniauxia sp. FL1348]|nr:carbohydrate esterase family 3 protein [Biscogniauxia sp. FL1348]
MIVGHKVSYKLIAASVVVLVFIIGLFSTSVDVDYQWNPLSKAHGGASNDTNSGPIAGGMPLRIMFLGASITRGEQSTGDRGYRLYMREKLTALGNPVNCVGFNRFGDFEDNDVEGYGAHRVREIHAHAEQAVPPLQPNLIIIQVGTSDCFRNDEPLTLLSRMRAMVDYLLEASPRATVLMSTLVTTPNLEFEPCVLSVNAQIRQVANDLIRGNKTVALAEMHFNQGLPNRPTPDDFVPDQIHPTDEGYFMMGDIFMQSIREVEKKGFLQSPVDIGIPDDGNLGREEEDRIREKAQNEHPLNL